MKTLSAGLAAHVASGSTTLCWCWRLTRRDGVVLGFTDHDRALTFDGRVFEAASGFIASDVSDGVGLSVDNLDVTGALSSAALGEDDLAAGLFDDAAIEIFRVNWETPAQRVLMRSGSLGEVTRAGPAFRAEMRGLAHYLQQPQGRLFQRNCDADLGDARCSVNLSGSLYRRVGSVVTVETPRRFTATGLDVFAHDFFTRGLLTFSSGGSAGQAIEIKAHAKIGGDVAIELWNEPRAPLAPGQGFSATAGCDKQFATCGEKFANAVNFRGFPAMPGNDAVAAVARKGRR